jgi:hypothetical protein
MSERVTNEQAQKIVGGAWCFVEPPDAAATFRDACLDLIDARADLAALTETHAKLRKGYAEACDGLNATSNRLETARADLARMRAEREGEVVVATWPDDDIALYVNGNLKPIASNVQDHGKRVRVTIAEVKG